MRRAWPHVTCSAFGRCCTICARCWKRSRICSRSSCSTCQRRAPPRGTSTSSHRSDRLRALRSAQWARAAHGHIQRRPIHYSWCSRQRAVRAASRTRLEQRRAHRVSLLRRRRARDRRAVCAARGLRRAARRCRHLQMLRLAMWPLRCVAPRRAARALHSELGRAPRTAVPACLTASPGPSGESASAPSCQPGMRQLLRHACVGDAMCTTHGACRTHRNKRGGVLELKSRLPRRLAGRSAAVGRWRSGRDGRVK